AQAGQVGLFGAKIEPALGGTGPDLVADAVITEELVGCGSGGVAAALGAHKDLGSFYLYRFGTEDQRKRWVAPAVEGRLITALAQRTLELAVAYARDRKAFGRPVAKFQVWRPRFAELATEIEAARSLSYHALRKIVGGEDATREVSMAKWYSTELDWRVADEA